ncbi:DUF1684 domain-containing protein [Curtobacterium sp. MCLR17_007]|uniref:DUF1684 domain-containing protein n=1 Tax=Curtobacterium sp. MCLR17_007 TaxID=2175648 RepID=UPI000DA7D78B|nr:DUF1684 domain-containing protein [Curtobacterium sp. MCLR17_007]WIB61751.1 DUF1684 domain-containing protein [Curtobacterium sp. MCLR17_007]
MTTASPTTDTTGWATWHAAHEAARASEHGFLSVTSIRWLTTTPERFDDVPGAWFVDQDGPVVVLADDPAERLDVDGSLVTGTHRFGDLDSSPAPRVVWHRDDRDVVIEVARRGGSDLVRPRDPAAPVRLAYRGTPTYAPDDRFVVEARFRSFAEPRAVTVGSVVDGLEHVFAARGTLEFDLDGPRTLLAFNGQGDDLHVLFSDRTSTVTTSATRTLDVGAPDADGRTRVDFTRATNLPCAYTPHATCPLPPRENRLDVAIEAGERLPGPGAAD